MTFDTNASVIKNQSDIIIRLTENDLVGSSNGLFRGLVLHVDNTRSNEGSDDSKYRCCIYVSPFHDNIPIPLGYAVYDNLKPRQKEILKGKFDAIGWFRPQYKNITRPEVGDIAWCTYSDIYHMEGGIYIGADGTASGAPSPQNNTRTVEHNSSVNPQSPQTSPSDRQSTNNTSSVAVAVPALSISGDWPDNTERKSSLQLSEEFSHPSFPLVPGDKRGSLWGLEAEDSLGLGRLAIYGQSNFGVRRPASNYSTRRNISIQLEGGSVLNYVRTQRDHLGIDLNAPKRAPVYALANARVVKMQPNKPTAPGFGYRGFGISITLCCGPMGYVTYNHLDSIEEGLKNEFIAAAEALRTTTPEEKTNRENYPEVRAGQIIAKNGFTFGSTKAGRWRTELYAPGSHVHLEWRRSISGRPKTFRRRQRIAELSPTDPIGANESQIREDKRVLDVNYLLVPTGLAGLSVKEGDVNNSRGSTGQGVFFRASPRDRTSRIYPEHLDWSSHKFPRHNREYNESQLNQFDQKYYIIDSTGPQPKGPRPKPGALGQEFRRIREAQLEIERSSDIQRLYENFPAKNKAR